MKSASRTYSHTSCPYSRIVLYRTECMSLLSWTAAIQLPCITPVHTHCSIDEQSIRHVGLVSYFDRSFAAKLFPVAYTKGMAEKMFFFDLGTPMLQILPKNNDVHRVNPKTRLLHRARLTSSCVVQATFFSQRHGKSLSLSYRWQKHISTFWTRTAHGNLCPLRPSLCTPNSMAIG